MYIISYVIFENSPVLYGPQGVHKQLVKSLWIIEMGELSMSYIL